MALRLVLLAIWLLAGATFLGPSSASAQGKQFFAVLLGGNEVSTSGDAAAGDPNGSGSAYVTLAGNELCYAIFVNAIGKPTLAHIHAERAGVNGGIFITLTPPPSGNTGHISDCVEVSASEANQIRNNTNLFYVNIHNGAFPNGALRGQLF